jgi:cell division protease FtsH
VLSREVFALTLQSFWACRKAIDKIVEILVEKETISGDEFRSILSQYTEIPEVNLAAVRRSQELQLA